MASLQEIHQQSYSDMPISEFAQKYHAKFYSDMPFDEFAKKTGLSASNKTEGGFATRSARGEDVQPNVSMPEALARGAFQGMSFNMADEFNAAARANPNQEPLPPSQNIGNMSDNERMFRSMRQGGNQGAIQTVKNLYNLATGDEATKDAYDRALRDERAGFKNAEAQRPISSLVGNIAGGAVIPMGQINNARQGAAVAGGVGALYGFGGGEDTSSRLGGAAVGAGLGGAIGAGLGKLASNASSAAPAANEVVQASERSGISVPAAVASDSATVQRLGQGVRNVPMAGEKIVQAVAKTGDEATAALDNLATGLGTGDIATAGQAVSTSIRNWVTGDSKKAVTAAYDAVDNLVNPNVTTPLVSTQGKIADIMARRAAERVDGQGQAVSFVLNAAQDAKGLTYEGLKGLRTRVGEMLDNPSMLPAGTSQAELKQIYGALTDDLGRAVENSGGPQARMAWEKANRFNQMVSQRREELAKITGTDADAAAEKVFSRLQAMASTSSSANISLLAKARSAVGSDWNEVGSAVVANLGRDSTGAWTPDRFVTAWGKLSESGKNVLFDKTTRQALDDIATISERMQQVGRRFGNSSGTSQNSNLISLAGAAFAGPANTLAALVGGNIVASALAKPATASSAAKWSRAYELAVTKPSAGTLSAFGIASRNFANTVSDKLGVNVTADHLMKALSGPARSSAQSDQEKQN